MSFSKKIKKVKKEFIFNLIIKDHPYIKSVIKGFIKKISRIFYSVAPKEITKVLHKFVTSESIIKNSLNNIFSTVYFELRTKCNGQCSFCAASIQNETRLDSIMSFDLYKKAIVELAEINYKGAIAFHVNSEPLLVKNIEEYISFARQHLKDSWIQILSNGKSLNSINGKKIIDAGIDELSLNIYNDDLKAELPKNIKKFEKEVLHKLFNKNQILTGHEEKRPKGKFIKYNIFKRLLTEILHSRAGTSPNKKINKPLVEERGFCEFPFQQFNVTANGNVSQCCCDLYFDSDMGNIKFQSLKEIWFGEKFMDLRKKLISGDRQSNPLCSKCDFFGLKRPPINFLRKIFYYLFKHS